MKLMSYVPTWKMKLRSGFSQLPTHGQAAYKSGSGPNVPLLLHVGRLLNYPRIDVLMEDVTKGFVLF